MSALSDLQKKLEQEAQGIMFPFSAKTPTVDTKQKVYNSATDGIMNMQGKKYVGPDAVIQYGSEEEGFARQLKQIEAPMLPQFDADQFPKAGEGIVQTPVTVTPPTVEPVQPVEPEQPAFDPCPAGFKFDPQLQRCVPIEKQKSDRDESVVVDRPRNIGKVANAIGSINEQIKKEGPGKYGQPVTYTIDNSNPMMALIPGGVLLDNFLFKPQKDKAMRDFANTIDGMNVIDKNGKQEITFQTEQAKTLYQRAMTEESLKGNIASTQKTNPDGSIVRDEFGRIQIIGPISQQAFGKIDEAFYERDKDFKTSIKTPIRQTGGDASVMEEVLKRQASKDKQESLMTAKESGAALAAGQTGALIQQQTQEREERKKEEKRQKAKIGYGQNIDQDIINANKRDSDREAQKQTGDSTMRAVTDRYGNPVRTTSGKVVTNPAPKSGGGGGGGSPKSIVCTAMYQSTGLQDWAKAMRIWYIYQKRYLTIQHQEGYHKLFKPFVKGMHKNKSIKALGSHVAKHRTQHLKHIMFNSKPSLLGKIYSNILEPVCYITGVIKTWKKK